MKLMATAAVLLALVFISGCDRTKKSKEGNETARPAAAPAYFNEKVRCSELANRWAASMAADDKPNYVFNFMLVDYSPKQQSCVAYFSYKGPTSETMFVQDILTNVMHFAETCHFSKDGDCATVVKNSRATYDDLTKLPTPTRGDN